MRYIARLNADLLPNEEPFGDVSTIADGTAIEGSDVVGKPDQLNCARLTYCSILLMAKPEASSTPVSDLSMIKDIVSVSMTVPEKNTNQSLGVSGSAHRVCMIIPQYETSAGGPFHRYEHF